MQQETMEANIKEKEIMELEVETKVLAVEISAKMTTMKAMRDTLLKIENTMTNLDRDSKQAQKELVDLEAKLKDNTHKLDILKNQQWDKDDISGVARKTIGIVPIKKTKEGTSEKSRSDDEVKYAKHAWGK